MLRDAGAVRDGAGEHALARTQIAVQRKYDRCGDRRTNAFAPGRELRFVQLERAYADSAG